MKDLDMQVGGPLPPITATEIREEREAFEKATDEKVREIFDKVFDALYKNLEQVLQEETAKRTKKPPARD